MRGGTNHMVKHIIRGKHHQSVIDDRINSCVLHGGKSGARCNDVRGELADVLTTIKEYLIIDFVNQLKR